MTFEPIDLGTCPCGNPLTSPKQKWCARNCTLRKRHQRGDTAAQKRRARMRKAIQKPCSICGKSPTDRGLGGYRYCSDKCQWEMRKRKIERERAHKEENKEKYAHNKWRRDCKLLLDEGYWLERGGEYVSAHWKNPDDVWRYMWPKYRDYRNERYEYVKRLREWRAALALANESIEQTLASEDAIAAVGGNTNALVKTIQMRKAMNESSRPVMPKRLGGGSLDDFKRHLLEQCAKKFELVPIGEM